MLILKTPSFFKADPNNPRKAPDDTDPRKAQWEAHLDHLGDDLVARGVLVPLLAKPDGALIDGWRRWLASQRKGIKELPVIITEKPETEIRGIQLATVFHKADLTAGEKWRACTEILAAHPEWQIKDLAEFLHLDPSMLTRLLSPSKCIPAWQEALKAGKVGISDCYAASKLPQSEQAGLLAMKLSGARWADVTDIPHLLEGTGLILGHIEGKPSLLQTIRHVLNPLVSSRIACRNLLMACQYKANRQIVRLTNAVHTAVFAPTGVGKGVSCVVPFLKTCPDSCLVIDPKGENARLSGEHRRRKFGHRVVILDPFKVMTSRPDTFNPLPFIDPTSTTALDECRDLASALVVRTGQEKEPHWNDSAETWIAAMISVVVAYAEAADKSLQAVRSLLTNPAKMEAAIKMMCESDMWAGMLARQGHSLAHFKDKELASTLTTTNRFLRFLYTIAVAESTKQSSFNPRDLLKGKMTVYLVLPPEHMQSQSALLRLWIGSLLRAVVKGGLQEKRKVHFVLDEAASLSHMESLDAAVDKYRGYGVRLQFYYQSLGQLKQCWPEGRDQTLMSNVTSVFIGVNDPDTAEYVSKRLGDETIVVESGGTTTGTSTSWQSSEQGHGSRSSSSSSSRNDNWSQMARRLLKPEEVTGLDPRIAITFTPGSPPIWTTLMRYFDKGFHLTHGIGPIKAVLDAASLLFIAGLIALMLTEALQKSGLMH